MKKFIEFLGYVLSSSPKASLRRFISFILMIPLVIGLFGGIFVAVKYQRIDFFIWSMILCDLPIMITLFGLQWQHVIEIVNKVKFPTNEKLDTEDIEKTIPPDTNISN